MKPKNYNRTVIFRIEDETVEVIFHNWHNQLTTLEVCANALRVFPALASMERLNRIMSKMRATSTTVEIGLPVTHFTFLYAGVYHE